MFKVNVVLMYGYANTDEFGCTDTHTHAHIQTNIRTYTYIDIDT